jgi:hypothetical protein
MEKPNGQTQKHTGYSPNKHPIIPSALFFPVRKILFIAGAICNVGPNLPVQVTPLLDVSGVLGSSAYGEQNQHYKKQFIHNLYFWFDMNVRG